MSTQNNDVLDDQKPKKKGGFWNNPTIFFLLAAFGFIRGILALNTERSSTFYFVMGVLWLGFGLYTVRKKKG